MVMTGVFRKRESRPFKWYCTNVASQLDNFFVFMSMVNGSKSLIATPHFISDFHEIQHLRKAYSTITREIQLLQKIVHPFDVPTMPGLLAKLQAAAADLRSFTLNPRSYNKRGKPSPNAQRLKSVDSITADDQNEPAECPATTTGEEQKQQSHAEQSATAVEKQKMDSIMPPKKSLKSKVRAQTSRFLSALNGDYPYNLP